MSYNNLGLMKMSFKLLTNVPLKTEFFNHVCKIIILMPGKSKDTSWYHKAAISQVGH